MVLLPLVFPTEHLYVPSNVVSTVRMLSKVEVLASLSSWCWVLSPSWMLSELRVHVTEVGGKPEEVHVSMKGVEEEVGETSSRLMGEVRRGEAAEVSKVDMF